MKINPEQRPEYKIEESIINNYQSLGYKNIHPPIRRVLLYRHAGVVDLALLPKRHKHKLVLVEAKHFANVEAGEKVIGQLLKYYSFALRLGDNGLRLLREFAETKTEIARSVKKTTPQQLCGGIYRDLAMHQMELGRKIKPQEIKLFVAVDGEVEKSLHEIVSTLRTHHKLNIGIIRVRKNTIRFM